MPFLAACHIQYFVVFFFFQWISNVVVCDLTSLCSASSADNTTLLQLQLSAGSAAVRRAHSSKPAVRRPNGGTDRPTDRHPSVT